MADITAANTTFIRRNVALGNTYEWVGQYAATTAAGSDTVATPLSVVETVHVFFASTAALTTATFCQGYPSTLAGSILVVNSTHDNLSIRYVVTGH